MDTQLMWIIIAAAVMVAAIVAVFLMQRNRSERLRRRFGPEYERTVRDVGVRKAEAALDARAARVARLQIRPLSPEDARQFSERWRIVQAQFVDDPRAAVAHADRLVGEVMQARGYPVGEFEQRVEDISVDHASVVKNYRAARAIAEQDARGQANTEDLRQAMVHYRALYAELLDQRPAQTDPAQTDPAQTDTVAERTMAVGMGRRGR